jgi:hypothetical protein
MHFINQATNQFSFGDSLPPGPGWELVSAEQFNALRSTGWSPTEYIQPHRVSKDTIVSRISSAGKVVDLMTLIAALSPEQKFLWDNYSWFNSDNQIVVQMCQQIGLDPAVILAVDPYI